MQHRAHEDTCELGGAMAALASALSARMMPLLLRYYDTAFMAAETRFRAKSLLLSSLPFQLHMAVTHILWTFIQSFDITLFYCLAYLLGCRDRLLYRFLATAVPTSTFMRRGANTLLWRIPHCPFARDASCCTWNHRPTKVTFLTRPWTIRISHDSNFASH